MWGRLLEESIYLATTLQHATCLEQLLSRTQASDSFLPAIAAVARKAQETQNALLFASLGSCTDVIRRCTLAGHTKVAASLILVAQAQEGLLAAWDCTLMVMESAVCDGEADVAVQSFRFASRIGPVIDEEKQQQQQQQQQQHTWRVVVLKRIGSALVSLISGDP